MKISNSFKYTSLTGTAVPLGALKTARSCGSGEYPDLIPFTDFCKKAGLGIVQLLPVNDTGTESSPYSALSAFALHPLYVSIDSVPEYAEVPAAEKQLTALHQKHDGNGRFRYRELRNDKTALLRMIFDARRDVITASAETPDAELNGWIKANEWVKEYAVFMELKRTYREASWKEWPQKYRRLSSAQIAKRWNDPALKSAHVFYAWLQMRTAQQFKKAADYAADNGVILKGDIPIMMNEDSADAWAHPEFFDDTLRAGSPPDGPNPVGQNWGFPIYRWDNLAKSGYSWWKQRLVSAAQYYKAYRIDHVLGFFRIWATSERETTAALGHTQPSAPITQAELAAAGFDDDRIRWLSQPHVPTRSIKAVNGGDYLGTHGLLHKLMDRIGTEELWRFKPEIAGDKDIWETPDVPDPVKAKLAEHWRDRTLTQIRPGTYSPLWTYRETSAWKSLSQDEQHRLGTLIADKNARMERLWEAQARTLLGELTGVTDMIACAEDLGANPESLPRVLADLSIMRLCVVRWCRHWEQPGQPFTRFEAYPALSVATSSVHDSSTLRLWWLTESDAHDFFGNFPPDARGSNFTAERNPPAPPGSYTPETARYLLTEIARANSRFCIHPIQDLLGLSRTYYAADPQKERVNIPGSVSEFNWTYRLPVPIETLAQDAALIGAVRQIADAHSAAHGSV
ncbi:4-alpha-glucanotransferase [Treponema brennaborense]|uniref:4-alpha-glucanotransferase n=1 Tax=Treponema brennaborense (strain DSM 12168 / CIP 105900 / DD5/3) TaxID=906968 RepID=F4LL73_TREBD|nr:4-alpha-glucanotransferase [Treponema brennaborense]AEE17647.1 4-alpha-glucanotransferase [Treponema brennaborense DSM 12168]